MKNQILFISIICLSFGCGGKKSSEAKFQCNSSFDFDEVEYLRNNFADSILTEIGDRYNMSNKNIFILNILNGNEPSSIDSLKALTSLTQIGFEEVLFRNDKYDELRSLLCKQKSNLVRTSFCIPIYRDILIFRKNEKIVGFVKICFDCDQVYWGGIGNNFGRGIVDFNSIKKLLY